MRVQEQAEAVSPMGRCRLSARPGSQTILAWMLCVSDVRSSGAFHGLKRALQQTGRISLGACRVCV